VYALARELNLPAEITHARPTTDTYSLAQGQDEFYFALPYEQMDLALWALNQQLPATDLAEAINTTPEHAKLIFDDIQAKRRATQYLHRPPVLVEEVPEIEL
jgi:NAD+ synthase